MTGDDFLAQETIRSAQYLIGVLYLVLFVIFWRFVSGRARWRRRRGRRADLSYSRSRSRSSDAPRRLA